MPPVAFYLASSLIEWPGRIAASLVLQGCNFKCPFCHSRDFVPTTPPASEVPLDAVLADLSLRKDWIDAVVVSGGEPCIHADLPDLLAVIKNAGFPVKLDTNGSNPDMLTAVIERGLADLVAMDVKAPLDDRYHAAAGTRVNLDNIRRSIDVLLARPDLHEFRTTFVPGHHAEPEAAAIAEILHGAASFYVQGFVNHNTLDPSYMDRSPYPVDRLRSFAEIIAPHVARVEVRSEGIVFENGSLTSE
ncbi:MAG: anaerobic ribonucleoside-triphosphate reductase activating protein [Planctomycetes bacterium]|nr:anaerobic ribonucleoside-triphosphate reductase activating protein [Planctomycetota bacterium]